MAQTARSIPANYPQPLGTRILKADLQRQVSIVRQEIVSDLLGVLTEAREANVRSRLVKLIENHLRYGVRAAHKAEDLWPAREEVQEIIGSQSEIKPAVAKRHLKLFEQFDRVQRRSLALLNDSFENIQLILDRIQPPDRTPSNSHVPAPTKDSL